MHRFEVVDRCFVRRDVEAAEAAAGLVLEAPRAVAEGRRPEPVHGVALDVLAGHERERLSRPVAEPDVDEPRVVADSHGHPEVVPVRAGRLLHPSAVDPGEVPRDIDAEPGEQRGERAVQVVAVPATAAEDPPRGRERVDRRRPAPHDVDGLVGDSLEVDALEPPERGEIDVARIQIEAEQLEVRARNALWQRRDRRDCHRGVAPSDGA